jgi:uncharacterized membrane protein YozB (DUF420 family)
MPGDWRKRLHGRLVLRELRSYVETRCSNHVLCLCMLWGLSTSLPICQNEFCPLCHARLLAEHEPNAVGSLRGDNLLIKAFLETAAPRGANVVLVLEIAMGIGLLLGARLARKGHFRQHAWCQSTIVLLNLAVVAVMMIPSFRVHVFPRVPAKLGKAYYALATTHGAFGTVTELAGLYILLSAGTSVLPEKLRISKYKVWMRSVLVLWWVVLLLGMATYTRWYVPHLFRK